MTDILSHDPSRTSCARAASIVSEVTEYHLNGGKAPQINIALEAPLVGGADYLLRAEITELSAGGQVVGLMMGGGASPAYLEAGTIEDRVTADPGADGQTTFCFRGLVNGTTATIVNVSLERADV